MPEGKGDKKHSRFILNDIASEQLQMYNKLKYNSCIIFGYPL